VCSGTDSRSCDSCHLISLSFDFQGDVRLISRRAEFSSVLTAPAGRAPAPGRRPGDRAQAPPARARYDSDHLTSSGVPRASTAPPELEFPVCSSKDLASCRDSRAENVQRACAGKLEALRRARRVVEYQMAARS
jgi:hypothetical protein